MVKGIQFLNPYFSKSFEFMKDSFEKGLLFFVMMSGGNEKNGRKPHNRCDAGAGERHRRLFQVGHITLLEKYFEMKLNPNFSLTGIYTCSLKDTSHILVWACILKP